MALQKTSIQIDPAVRQELEGRYVGLTISEIIRLSLEYVLEKRPVIQPARTVKLTDGGD